MGSISKQIFFNAPLDKVWKIWTDVEKTPEWVSGVEESRITGAIREGKGLKWEEVCTLMNQKIQVSHEYTDWESPKKTVMETELPMGATLKTIAQFKKETELSEANLHLEWNLGILGGMIGDDQVRVALEKALDVTAANWKSRAES